MQTPHPWRGIRPWKRHSLVLLVAGAVYIAIGGGFIFPEPTPQRLIALQIALDWWSLNVWGYIFVFAGILSIISSRWPPVSEKWGYAVLTGLSSGWGAFYAAGVIFGDSSVSNLNGALSWGLLGFMWWAISGLTNPTVIFIEAKPEDVDGRDERS